MKKILSFGLLFTALFIFGARNAEANVLDYQIVELKDGWNIVSTPKVLSSYEFSVAETSTNFDIYLLDPSSPSGWQTMQGLGQDKFEPLFAYFINNKTGQDQTLKFVYNFNLTPAQRLFQRTLQQGWNAVGVANPGYALGQGAPSNLDTNNPASILSSISSKVGQVIDFTHANTNPDSPFIADNWLSKNINDVNSLKDFRELKAYGVFITETTNNFIGSQNLQIPDSVLPVITLNGDSNIEIMKNDLYTDLGATASDNIDGDITANIVVSNNVNINTPGTYYVKYNITDSSGNNAVEITRTVVVKGPNGSMTVEKDPISPSGNITLSGNDITLGVYKFTAFGEPFKIETLKAGFVFTDGDSNNNAVTLRNGKILVSTDGTNWIQYGSTATLLPAGTSYTLNYTVNPGTPIWVKVNADIYDNDGTGTLDSSDTIKAILLAGNANAQAIDSLGSLNIPATDVSGNTLNIASASLVTTKNNTYANQSVSLPATAFKIGAWNIEGSSVEDVLLTTLSFDVDTVIGETFNHSDLTNMYVVVKKGSTVVAQPAPLATVSVTDNNFSINYTLAKNTNIVVELYANLGSNVTIPDSFTTDLSVSGTATVSGTSVNSNDIQGQNIASNMATITATMDASSPVTTMVHDNQTVTAGAFRFAAVNTGFNVTDLTFTLANATVAQTVEIYDGATLVASRPGGTTLTFNGLAWNVPANQNKVLTVKLVLGGVGIGAGTSGSSQLVTLTNFTAINTSSGASAFGTESNPTGNEIYAYASTPTITNVVLPTTVLTVGTKTIARFSVSSNGGTIGWKKIVFNVVRTIGGTDTLSGTTLFNADTNTAVLGTITYSGGIESDNGIVGTIEFVADNEEQVSGSKTYELRTNVAGTLNDGDNINVNIAQPSIFATPTNYSSIASTDSSFIWTDTSAVSHGENTNDWNNSYLVKNLPTSLQTMLKSN